MDARDRMIAMWQVNQLNIKHVRIEKTLPQ